MVQQDTLDTGPIDDLQTEHSDWLDADSLVEGMAATQTTYALISTFKPHLSFSASPAKTAQALLANRLIQQISRL